MKEFKFDINAKLDEQVLLNAAIIYYMKDTLNASNEELANLLYIPEEKVELYYNRCGKFIVEDINNINYPTFNSMYLSLITKNDVHEASRLYRNVSGYERKGGRPKIKGTNDLYWEQKDVTTFSDELLKQLAESYYYNVFCNVSTTKIAQYFIDLSQPTIAKYLSVCVPKILGLNDDHPTKQFFLESLKETKRNHTPQIQEQILKAQTESTNWISEGQTVKVIKDNSTIEKKEIKSSAPSFDLVLNELVDIENRLAGIHSAIKADPDYYLDHCFMGLSQAYDKLNNALENVSAKEYRSKSYNDQFMYVLKAATDKLASILSLFNTIVQVTSESQITLTVNQKKEDIYKLTHEFKQLLVDIKGE